MYIHYFAFENTFKNKVGMIVAYKYIEQHVKVIKQFQIILKIYKREIYIY